MVGGGGAVIAEALKLSVFFGERDRFNGHLVSDVLLDVFEHHEVKAAVLLRATEGFGIKQQLHTQRILTLSEDLPLVATAVDERERVLRLLPDVEAVLDGGLITIERARLVTALDEGTIPPIGPRETTKLTLYLGRQEQAASRAAYEWVVDVLRRNGVAGATVLLGVDGLVHHARKRARFLSRNADVPLILVSVGERPAIAAALSELSGQLEQPLATLERCQVCKRDGRSVSTPLELPETDPTGLGVWHKLTIYASEQARHGHHPLYIELIHRLRLEGASGATALRGIWGDSGDHVPHGESPFALRRRVPVVLTVVDRPSRIQQWWPIVDDVTSETGLVTSEMVPASLASAPGVTSGGLELAYLRPG